MPFPLPFERVLWSGRPAWWSRAARRGDRYALTEFRLVCRSRDSRTWHEVAVHEIESVEVRHSLRRVASVYVTVRGSMAPLVLIDVRDGAGVARAMQLLASGRAPDEARAVLASHPRAFGSSTGASHPVGIALVLLIVSLGALQLDRPSHPPSRDALTDWGPRPIVYSAADPIAPNGQMRSRGEIEAFMAREVMPFARQVLAPLVGGPANVTCQTCHGEHAEPREWRMPGVRALPKPDLRFAGLERSGHVTDPWLRNAIYADLAVSDKQPIAVYMRQVVMPGMAKLLGRPPYDFTKPYSVNRSRAALGCYHCHEVTGNQ